MRKLFTLIGVLALILVSSAALVTVTSADSEIEYEAHLTGNPDAAGEIEVEFYLAPGSESEHLMEIEIEMMDLVEVLSAHLHCVSNSDTIVIHSGASVVADGHLLDDALFYNEDVAGTDCTDFEDLASLEAAMASTDTGTGVYAHVHLAVDGPISGTLVLEVEEVESSSSNSSSNSSDGDGKDKSNKGKGHGKP